MPSSVGGGRAKEISEICDRRGINRARARMGEVVEGLCVVGVVMYLGSVSNRGDEC